MKNSKLRLTPTWQFVLTVLFVAGCGSAGRLPVSGTLTTSDGEPLVGARISVRCDETGDWATAVTDTEGHFELGGEQAGDGVPPGAYYVVVEEDRGDWDEPKPRKINPKYERPAKSGITLNVPPGGDVQLDLKLDPP